MKVPVFTNLYPNNVWLNHGCFIKERMLDFDQNLGVRKFHGWEWTAIQA
jgi:hypothetical protein